MRKGMQGLMLSGTMCLIAFALPESAYAQDVLSSCPPEGSVGLTEYTIECFRGALIPAAVELCEALYTAMVGATSAMIMLSIGILGFKISAGMVKQLSGEITMLAIKIAGVAYFTATFVDWVPRIFEVMDGLLEIVTEVLLQAMLLEGCQEPAGGGMSLWTRVDCVMGAYFGFGVLTGLFSGILGLVIGMGASASDMGGLAFVGGVSAAFSFFFSVARAVYGYLVAHIAITFLSALAPLFVPMVLLEGTKQYFNKWVQAILSYMLQPVFLFGFIALSITAVDRAVFTGEASIATTLFGTPVESVQQWNEQMNLFYQRHAIRETELTGRTVIQEHETSDYSDAEEWSSQLAQGSDASYFADLFSVDNLEVMQENLLNRGGGGGGVLGASDGSMLTGYATVSIQADIQMELMIHFFALAMIFYILYMLMEVVPDIARDIVGSFSQVRLGGEALPLQDEARAAINNSGNLLNRVLSQTGGQR